MTSAALPARCPVPETAAQTATAMAAQAFAEAARTLFLTATEGGLRSPGDARTVLAACWEATGTLGSLLLPELARALRDMDSGHTALAVQFAYLELARISERLRSAGQHLGREGMRPASRAGLVPRRPAPVARI